jgi:hypothetical protein
MNYFINLLNDDNGWKPISFYLFNKFVDEGYISQLKYECGKTYDFDDFNMKIYKPSKEELSKICDEKSMLYNDLINAIEICERNKCSDGCKRILTHNNHIIFTKLI